MQDRNVTSIVIVNWNSGAHLENCVRSLLDNTPGSQLIIIDNASTDSSLNFTVALRHRLRIRINSRNIGFAAACNIGWRVSDGERVLFLNPDTECCPGAVDSLEQAMDSDAGIWATGGQLVDSSGKPQIGFNIRVFPSTGSVAAEMLLLDEIWPSNPWSGSNRYPPNAPEMDVEQPAAACLMVSRNALEALGGFDEGYFPAWFEDVDLCRRIHDHGGRIRYQPRARFLHHGGYSLELMSREDFLQSFHRNQIRYFLKHHGAPAALRVKRLIVVGLFARALLSIIHPMTAGKSRIASAGIFWRAARTISGLSEASL